MFRPPAVGNSPRLKDLIRAGTLYLTVQDAIALVLENNIDIEVARYSPITGCLAIWSARKPAARCPVFRAALRTAGTVASGQGVAGSEAGRGRHVHWRHHGHQQNIQRHASPRWARLRKPWTPAITGSAIFSHTSVPQFNNTLSLTNILISATHVYNASCSRVF